MDDHSVRLCNQALHDAHVCRTGAAWSRLTDERLQRYLEPGEEGPGKAKGHEREDVTHRPRRVAEPSAPARLSGLVPMPPSRAAGTLPSHPVPDETCVAAV